MADVKIDLRGICCPLNYVKTKLELEKLSAGQTLEVLLDDGEPIMNVPRSARDDGYKILEVKKLEEGGYSCRILKG